MLTDVKLKLMVVSVCVEKVQDMECIQYYLKTVLNFYVARLLLEINPLKKGTTFDAVCTVHHPTICI